MRWRLLPLALLPAVFWSGPLRSQVTGSISLLVAIDLPVTVAEARIEGFPSDEISGILSILLGGNVSASDACEVINVERVSRRKHGPVDNFGAFVQSQLHAGLRGRELAAAIRAEHVARGRGMGKGKARGVANGHRGDHVVEGFSAGKEHRRIEGSKGGRPEGHPAARGGKHNDKGKPAHRSMRPNR
jgi:hypothetical protein